MRLLLGTLLAASMGLYYSEFCDSAGQCVKPLFGNATSTFLKVANISTVAVNLGALCELFLSALSYPKELMLAFGAAGRGLIRAYERLPGGTIPAIGGVLAGTEAHVRQARGR